jgi:hypothetical protein
LQARLRLLCKHFVKLVAAEWRGCRMLPSSTTVASHPLRMQAGSRDSRSHGQQPRASMLRWLADSLEKPRSAAARVKLLHVLWPHLSGSHGMSNGGLPLEMRAMALYYLLYTTSVHSLV